MAKSKLTLQQQYDKEIKRIEKLIKNAENIGFEWVQTPIPPKPKRVTEASVQKLKKITPQNIYKTAVYNDPISQTQFTGEQGQTIIKYRQTVQNDTILKNNSIDIPNVPHPPKTPKTKRKQTPRPKEIKKDKKRTPALKHKVVESKLVQNLYGIREMLKNYTPPQHWSEAMATSRMGNINVLIQQVESLLKFDYGAPMLDKAHQRVSENFDKLSNLLIQIFYDSDQWYVETAINEFFSIILGGAMTLEINETITDIQEIEQGFDVI